VSNEAATGSCYNCAFLCRRDGLNLHLSAYYELTQPLVPWCYRDVPLLQEIREVLGSEPQPVLLGKADLQESQNAAAKRAVTRQRGCQKWYAHKPGRGPEQHLRELEAQQLEQRREDFEKRMEQERRDFEERLQQRYHGLGKWIALLALGLAAAEVVAAISGAGPGSIIGDLLGLD
jgi:hypothetical protein